MVFKCARIAILFTLSTFLLMSFGFANDAVTGKFRAISYNVWGLPVPFLSKPGRFQKIHDSIGRFNADFIGFQETFTKKSAPLKEIEGYPYMAEGPQKKGIKILHSGLLFISKFPILETATLAFSKCSGMDCFARKGVLWSKVLVPGFGTINVFLTHANAGSNESVKMHQLIEAAQFIDQKRGDRPTIFLGDFNLTPGSDYYHYVRYVMGLDDALDLYLKEHPERATDPSFIYTVRIGKKFYKRRIDYFFLQDGLQSSIYTKNYQVIMNKIDGDKLSDHFGVLGDFELRN